ncbi:hypothetical protein [Ktedonospora formicarum]|uniref:HTH cro/C1-type domain-containing protein n=1 Tax=Ktedonospora formicarum TaxID=2778364 RepID=A0A8J3I2V8_9CHLR|nr:hypothetical protein [Ktedonospora formicarum]GHO43884.1 hypothetical protein KSX_20470 [Ktedonospora formicarum]
MSDRYTHPLRAMRQRLNLTQKRLAIETGIAPQTIMRAEQNKPINAESRRLLCLYFGVNSEILGLCNDTRERYRRKEEPEVHLAKVRAHTLVRGQELAAHNLESSDMEHSRRNFLQVLGMTGTSLATSPANFLYPPLWERLSHALTQPSSIDEDMIFHLEAITRDSWRVLQSMTGTFSQSLLQYVLQRLEAVTQLLSSPLPSTKRARLAIIAADFTQIAGELLFDMKENEQANHYYQVGLEAAQFAGDPVMQTAILGRRCFIPIYEKRPEHALTWLQQAQAISKRDVPPITRAWLSSIEAEAYANLHQSQGSLQALDMAEYYLDHSNSTYNSENAHTRFSYSILLGYQGVCNLKLQRPKVALEALERAFKQMEGTRTRHRTIVLTDIAEAYLQMGEVEAALSHIEQAINMLKQVKSARVLQRLIDLNKKLEPWRSMPVVKKLDEQLIALHPLLTLPC